MLKVKDIVTPSPQEWNIIIRGMRNAFKSWDKSDSFVCSSNELDQCCYEGCPFVDHWEDEEPFGTPVCKFDFDYDEPVFVLGENDKKLMLNLTKLGTSDRKVLRQLPIILEVNAPLYWWKQADKYQIGTVTNSESTMHTITKHPFTLDDFSLDYSKMIDEPEGMGTYENVFSSFYLKQLNDMRDKYLETDNDIYKHLLFEWLPESYMQARTWSLNYEVALQMIHQRKNHPLEEWHTLITYLLNKVPYLKEIYEASCYQENTLMNLKYDNKDLKDENKELKEVIKKLEEEINLLEVRVPDAYSDEEIEEVWKDIQGHEDYQVSNLGSVRKKGSERRKLAISPYGSVCCNIRGHNYGVAGLVARAFLDNPDNKTYVAHKNGLARDNRAVNLEYSDKKINKHQEKSIGEMAKNLYEDGLGIARLSEILGITQQKVREILSKLGVTLRTVSIDQ